MAEQIEGRHEQKSHATKKTDTKNRQQGRFVSLANRCPFLPSPSASARRLHRRTAPRKWSEPISCRDHRQEDAKNRTSILMRSSSGCCYSRACFHAASRFDLVPLLVQLKAGLLYTFKRQWWIWPSYSVQRGCPILSSQQTSHTTPAMAKKGHERPRKRKVGVGVSTPARPITTGVLVNGNTRVWWN